MTRKKTNREAIPIRKPKEQLVLNEVASFAESIGWLEKMTGEKLDYGRDTLYLNKIFSDYRLPRDRKILQSYIYVVYIIYMQSDIVNIRYFKSVDTALRFLSMYQEKGKQMEKQIRKEKKKEKEVLININSRLKTINRLGSREI